MNLANSPADGTDTAAIETLKACEVGIAEIIRRMMSQWIWCTF
jgi:hypothetical protein